MVDANTNLPEGAFGPSERGGRVRTGGPDWLRLGVMLMSMVLILTLSFGATAAGVLLYGTQNIDNVTVEGLVQSGQQVALDEGDGGQGGDSQNDVGDLEVG